MRNIEPPYLELGFYLVDGTQGEAFARFARLLTKRGARLRGPAYVVRGSGARARSAVCSPTEENVEVIPAGESKLRELLREPDTRVLRFEAVHTSVVFSDTRDVVTVLWLSSQSLGVGRNPIGIWTDGSWLDDLGAPDVRGAEFMSRALAAFADLCTSSNAAYGAISIDESLLAPTDMVSSQGTISYLDLYVSSRHVGAATEARVRALLAGMRVIDLPSGVLFSGSLAPEFSYDERYRDLDAAARAIGHALILTPLSDSR